MVKKILILVVALSVSQGLSAQSAKEIQIDTERRLMSLDRKISELEGKTIGFIMGALISVLGAGGTVLGASSNSPGPAVIGGGATLVGTGIMAFNLYTFMTTSVEIEQSRQRLTETLNQQVYVLSRQVELQSQ